jgi:hypothetical protein
MGWPRHVWACCRLATPCAGPVMGCPRHGPTGHGLSRTCLARHGKALLCFVQVKGWPVHGLVRQWPGPTIGWLYHGLGRPCPSPSIDCAGCGQVCLLSSLAIFLASHSLGCHELSFRLAMGYPGYGLARPWFVPPLAQPWAGLTKAGPVMVFPGHVLIRPCAGTAIFCSGQA